MTADLDSWKQMYGEMRENVERLSLLLETKETEPTNLRTINMALQLDVIEKFQKANISEAVPRMQSPELSYNKDERHHVVEESCDLFCSQQEAQTCGPDEHRGPESEASSLVPYAVLEHIERSWTDSPYVKNLAVALWGSDKLKTKSVSGATSNRYKQEVREALSPAKVIYIRESLERRLKRRNAGEEEVEACLRKVPKFLYEKISDVRRKSS